MKTTTITTLARALVIASLASQIAGCDLHVDKQQALHVQALTQTRILLVNMEAYKEKNGHLPTSLSELANSEPALARMNLAAYTYRTGGIPVADGSLWLLLTPDSKDHGRVIVGRLPIEVTNTMPASPHPLPMK